MEIIELGLRLIVVGTRYEQVPCGTWWLLTWRMDVLFHVWQLIIVEHSNVGYNTKAQNISFGEKEI